MITEINESKALIKHISYECICRLNGRKCNSDQCRIMINDNVSVKNAMYMEKIMNGIQLQVIVKVENI